MTLEYTTTKESPRVSSEALDARLTAMGSEGWRLVSVSSMNLVGDVMLWWERESVARVGEAA